MHIEYEAIYTIWLREVIRYFRAKERIIGSIMQPLLWFLIFGAGIGASIQFRGLGINFLAFLAPGIVTMTLLFTSVFSGVSVIWDREFGFLKEILVAPVSRISIVLGKALGGATTALLQGLIIIVLALLFKAPIPLTSVLLMLPLMILISVGFVSMGLTIASLMDTMEGFQLVMNFLVQPMFFLSGVFFPINSLPEWIRFVVYLNPMTYAVESMRAVAINYSFLPLSYSLLGISLFSLIMLFVASLAFGRRE